MLSDKVAEVLIQLIENTWHNIKELGIDLHRLLIVKRDWISNIAAVILGAVVGTILLLLWVTGGIAS